MFDESGQTTEAAAIDAPAVPARKKPDLATMLYSAIAITAFTLSVLTSLHIFHRLHRSHLYTAEVVRVIDNPDLLSWPRHFPIFRVQLLESGTKDFVGLAACGCHRYRVGKLQEVWLDPAHPLDVKPKRFSDIWFLPMLLFVAGWGFSAFALVTRWIAARPPKPPRPIKTDAETGTEDYLPEQMGIDNASEAG